MKAVLQRVSRAAVRVDSVIVGSIERGLVVLLGVTHGDTRDNARHCAEKIATLRVFADDAGKFNRSLLDVGGAALVVSQFTLLADTHKGRRPSFLAAAPPDLAEPLVSYFAGCLNALGVSVQTGRFGAHMEVDLVNDGPVTIVLDFPPT